MRRLSFFFFIIFYFVGCTDGGKKEKNGNESSKDPINSLSGNYFNDCKKLYREARKMDSILLEETSVDKQRATAGIKAFADFASYCQGDSMAPVYLIKGAQVAKAINNIPQAKILLDKCVESYPSFKNRPAALFLLAQLYDEDTYLSDETEAKKLYVKIIEEYPKSDWALSAKGAMSFLGKTDEEIMKELKEKNQRKSSGK